MTTASNLKKLIASLDRRTILLLGSGASRSATQEMAPDLVKKLNDGWKKRTNNPDSTISEWFASAARDSAALSTIPHEQWSTVANELRCERLEAHWLVVRNFEGRRAFVAMKDTGLGFPWTPVPPSYAHIAALVRAECLSPYILTTNWDELLEIALHAAGLSVSVLFGGAQEDHDWKELIKEGLEENAHSERPTRAVVVKLHGTISHAFSVLGALDDIVTLHPAAKSALSELIKAHQRVVAVGWSARDDDITSVFEKYGDALDRWSIGGNPEGAKPPLLKFLRNNERQRIPCNADKVFQLIAAQRTRDRSSPMVFGSKVPNAFVEASTCSSRDRRQTLLRQAFDTIYRPSQRVTAHAPNICDTLSSSCSNGVLIVHAANRKEIPDGVEWRDVRNTFFSPLVSGALIKSIAPRPLSVAPPYAIVDLTYPGDYPFAAHSKDISHIYRVLSRVTQAGYAMSSPSPILNEIQVTSNHLAGRNVVLLGGPDSNRWVLLSAILREAASDYLRLPLRMWYMLPDHTYRADSDTLWHDFPGVTKEQIPNPTREFTFDSLEVSSRQHYGIVLVFPNPFSVSSNAWMCVAAGLQNTGTQAAMLAFADVIHGEVEAFRFEDGTDQRRNDRWSYCLLVEAIEAIENPEFSNGDIAAPLSAPKSPSSGRWSPSYLVTRYRYFDLDSGTWRSRD